MPSELSRQLDDFRTKHKVVPAVQKVSFLFDPKRAAGLDVLSLAIIARKSLLDLAEVEPSLAVFEELFVGTDKSVEFLNTDEQSELQGKIKRLLSFLSAHFKTLDAQQCIEYLVQKYNVHVYNGEELILMALPYHDSPLFGTLVKLIPFFKHIERANPSETRWMFLRNVFKTGSPLSRQALVKMCRSSQPVMTAIIDHVIDSLKHGAFNEPLLAFANVLLLEVLAEFPLIKFDISIPLFSLCRICFKAAQHNAAAFFVGISVATHIVCVADVRDDALSILLSRAIAVCPADKAHALLMSLTVVASRRQSLPASVVQAISSIPQLEEGVNTCVTRFKADMSELLKAVSADDLLVAKIVAAREAALAIPGAAPQLHVVAEPVVSESAESSSDDSDSEDSAVIMRKTLNALIAKGTKKDRLAAVDSFAPIQGSTRYCIRLSALCGSVDALATTMKHCKNDAGFVPTLVGVLDQFSSTNPRLVLQAIFADLAKIPAGSIGQIGAALGVPAAASLMAVARNVEAEFSLCEGVWESLAAIVASPAGQLGKTALLAAWRAEHLPAGFLATQLASKESIQSFSDSVIEFANNVKTARCVVATEHRVNSVVGQLVCSLAVPNAMTRQALTGFVQKSLVALSIALRTDFLTAVLATQSPAVFRKLAELEVGDIKSADSQLVAAAVAAVSGSHVSVDSWVLVKRLVESGLVVPADVLVAAVKSSSGPTSVAAWKCVSACIAGLATNPLAVHAILAQIGESLSAASSVSSEVSVMIETLLSVASLDSASSLVTAEIVADLVKRLTVFVIRTQASISDTLVVTAQTVCESLLTSGLDFAAAWTTVVQVMSELSQLHPESAAAIQVRCLVLLASLVEGEETDSETVTSKQLGQVVLGLVELVSVSSTSAVDSWLNIAGTPTELAGVVERIVSQFLLHCTLRKLDKMFRRLLASGDNDAKLALVLRVYAAVCTQGGSAAALALLPVASDAIVKSLKSDASAKKRKRNVDLILAALAAVTASCVEEIPESSVSDFVEAVADLPGVVDDNSAVSASCCALARVGTTDHIKHLTKLLMQRSRDQSAPATQEAVVKTVLALWQSAGDAMVPAITEVTVYLSELYNSSEDEVASATRQLVQEMDRITGEDIASKLRDGQ